MEHRCDIIAIVCSGIVSRSVDVWSASVMQWSWTHLCYVTRFITPLSIYFGYAARWHRTAYISFIPHDASRGEKKMSIKLKHKRIVHIAFTCPPAIFDWYFNCNLRDVPIRSSLCRYVRNRQVLAVWMACIWDVGRYYSHSEYEKEKFASTLIMHNSVAGWFCSQGNFTVVTPYRARIDWQPSLVCVPFEKEKSWW